MLPKADNFQYIHRGMESELNIVIAPTWTGNSQSSEGGMAKARKVMLEKFDFFPAPEQQLPEAIIIHINNSRGKFLRHGNQTDIWSIINAQPNPGVENMPVTYVYQPFVLDFVDVGPYDNELTIRFTDQDDKDLVFVGVYTICFSISNGYE